MTRTTIIPTISIPQIFSAASILLILSINSLLLAEPSDQFKRRDVDRNGILEAGELNGIPPALIKRLDQNQDGKISAREDETLFKPQPRFNLQTFNYAGNDNPRQQLDILTPKTTTKNRLPCLIFVHGGAWRSGNKSQGHSQIRDYVNSQQFVGVSIGYRLSEEAIWPAQIHDCKAAIRFLYAKASQFNIDTSRLIVFGTSAGGHLAATIATTGNEGELNGMVGVHLDQPSHVAGAISYFGPTDFLRMDDFPSNFKHDDKNSPESQLVGGPIQSISDKTRAANPITYLDRKDPPLICIHGDHDNSVPFNQSELLYQALRAKKIPTALIKIANGGHGGFRNPAIKELEKQFFMAIALGKPIPTQSQTIPNQSKQ